MLQRVKVEEEETRMWQYNRNKKLINFFTNSHLMDSTYRFSNVLISYDKFGNKINENHSSQDLNNEFQKINTEIKMEFDSLGNWTKKHTFRNDSLIDVTGRIIWYEN